jgi:hypothetical protein
MHVNIIWYICLALMYMIDLVHTCGAVAKSFVLLEKASHSICIVVCSEMFFLLPARLLPTRLRLSNPKRLPLLMSAQPVVNNVPTKSTAPYAHRAPRPRLPVPHTTSPAFALVARRLRALTLPWAE